MAKKSWASILSVGIVGLMTASCSSSRERQEAAVAFRDVYRPAPAPERAKYERQTFRVTLDGVPLWEASRRLAKQAGVSVAVSDQVRSIPVVGHFEGATISEVLAGIAASVNVPLSKTGRAYFLGNVQLDERASLVRPVVNADPETIREAVGSLADRVTAVVSPQGVVVITGSWTAVAEAEVLLDSLEGVDVGRWIVQLVFLEVTEQAAEELAVTVTPSADVALRLASDAANSIDAGVALEAVLNAAASIQGVETLAEPLLVVLEGETAELIIGERFPIRNRTVSDQGTVSDRDVSYLQTGLEVRAGVTTAAADVARLNLEFVRSNAVGESDGIPVVATQTFKTKADLQTGGVYLVGSLDSVNRETKRGTWLNLGRADLETHSRIQVWARVHRYRAEPPADPGWTRPGHGDITGMSSHVADK